MRKRREMTCEEFTARMARLVASGKDIFAHPHVKSCKTHRALLEDLEAIARAARQLFPEVDPPDQLWKQIEVEVAREWGIGARVSRPFPGCCMVFRVRMTDAWDQTDTATAHNQVTGQANVPLPEARKRAGGTAPPPPHHGKERG